ncbi:MAG: hydroxymethylbilane synthase [Gammaproteobacteria bacterium]|nr:hydroxymethylbilane synthase [Gammaproteobacteria bacterium]
MTSRTLRIATRKSPLALWQAGHVRDSLCKAHPGLEVTIIGSETRGDKLVDVSLANMGGKGLFIKELEQALLDGNADIAVHSMKDVTVELPEGLDVPVMLVRDDPRDVLISHRYTSLNALPEGASVGTSSLRRQCQLRAYRRDLMIKDLRGNVGTRLKKLDEGNFDAIVVAAAGVKRLELARRITEYLEPETILPAIGQGAIGIECRANDKNVLDLIAPLNHTETQLCVGAERAVNRRLYGGCQLPISAFAELSDGVLSIRALVGRIDGSRLLRASIRGRAEDFDVLGTHLAEELLSRGADEVLEELVPRE